MENTYEAGQKIEYRLLDKAGKAHWFKGLIHGVKRIEDPATNMIISISYLVDTGRHERIDEVPHNPRGTEIHKRASKLIRTGEHTNFKKVFDEVAGHSDLPDEGIVIDKVRQPEQIELPAEFIRPRK